MRKILIVIVSYNAKRHMQACLESIRKNLTQGSYKVAVVDNASTDGISDWLELQKDIIFIKNTQNIGFGPACNQAVSATIGTEFESYDIFLLNNDTVITAKAIPIMAEYLTDNDDVGAVGAMSNYAGNRQSYPVEFSSTEDYIKFGNSLNAPDSDAYVEKTRLNGFALLIRRTLWDDIGGFDEDFAPGYYEDDAISVEILKRGYRLVLCRNSFIYHVGSASFVKTGTNKLSYEHHKLFIQKYGFDILDYVYPCGAVISQIPFARSATFNVLHIGCGLGAELKAIRSLFPNACLYGVESDSILYSIVKNTEKVFTSIQEVAMSTSRGFFNLLIVDSNYLNNLNDFDKEILVSLCSSNAVEISRIHNYDDFSFDKIALIIWDKNVYSQVIADNLANWGIMSSVYSTDNLRKRIASYGLPQKNILLISNDSMLRASSLLMFPELNCEEATIVPYLMAHFGRLPQSDVAHRNASELEILEMKYQSEKQYECHEDFLNDSELTVSASHKCHEQIPEILRILNNAYKLGQIEKCYDKTQLVKLLANEWNDCVYITAKDKYANYGVVGFSCFNQRENKGICHVTSWFMNEADLNRHVEISDSDISSVNDKKPNSIRILLKGNENLHPIADYLIGGSVTTEYDNPFRFNISPFPTKLNSTPFHIIIFSLMQEDYSAWEHDSEEMLSQMFKTFENLVSHTPGNPTIILLLGYESESSLDNLPDGELAELHYEINPLIRDFASEHPNIRTINVADYINSLSDFNGSVNQFVTRIYSDIVEKIVVYINEKVDHLLATK
ncbi:glycosyltransferase family 2 protein [Butyrivibrio sp. VCB2001]|uniref:glycosyltransferase family 2 protein n=1 Tax=Butyrivibrio sp. VCB2001 TaxID=1280667 RepID=UPI00041C3E6D|nr:glycosyltransferase family 2 protein [Butyrivibrio sp. VCB2001]